MPTIQIDDDHQKQIIISLIMSKQTELARIRGIIDDLVLNNTIPQLVAAGPLAQIAAEQGACDQALQTLGTSPIGFPTSQQIAALRASVSAVAAITAQNAATVGLAVAVSNLVTSYPP